MQELFLKIIQPIHIIFLFVLVACTPASGPRDSSIPGPVSAPISSPGPIGSGQAQPNGNDGGVEGSGNGDAQDEAGHGGNVAALPGGAPQALPQNSIPAPSLKKGKVIAYSPDSQTTDVVIGQVGAVQQMRQGENDIEGALSNAGPSPIPNGTQVLVSVNEINVPNQSPNIQLNAPVGAALRGRPTLKNVANALIPSANAQEIVLPQPDIQNEICARIGNTCCDVNPDGSFGTSANNACTIQLRDRSVSQLYLAVMDADGNRSAPVTERIQERIPYFKTASSGITSAPSGGMLYSLNGDKVITAKEEGSSFKLLGDYAQDYHAYDAQGARGLSYDITNNLLALNKQNSLDLLGLSLTNLGLNPPQGGGAINLGNAGIPQVISTSTVAPDAGEETTQMKFTTGKISYGTKTSTARFRARIYRVRGSDLSQDFIQFFWKIPGLVEWNHKETITFDVDAAEYGLAVYKNDADQVRLRIGNQTKQPQYYGDVILSGVDSTSLKDIQIYRANIYDNATRQLTNGLALLLDSQNNRIGIVSFNHWGRTFSVNLDQWLDLGANKNPQAFVFDIDKKRAYVVNKGDGTITVLKLDTATGYPEIAGSVDLKQTYLPDKDFIFVPTNIVYQPASFAMGQPHLVVSLENMKGALVADVPNF